MFKPPETFNTRTVFPSTVYCSRINSGIGEILSLIHSVINSISPCKSAIGQYWRFSSSIPKIKAPPIPLANAQTLLSQLLVFLCSTSRLKSHSVCSSLNLLKDKFSMNYASSPSSLRFALIVAIKSLLSFCKVLSSLWISFIRPSKFSSSSWTSATPT